MVLFNLKMVNIPHRMILKTLKVVIPHFRKQGDQDVVDSC